MAQAEVTHESSENEQVSYLFSSYDGLVISVAPLSVLQVGAALGIAVPGEVEHFVAISGALVTSLRGRTWWSNGS